jgi:putative hemolysin
MVTQVNLRKMLEDKMHRKPNRFLVALIRWVLIEDWLNKHMAKIGDKQGVDFMQGVVDVLDIKVEVFGEENLPKAGTPYMFVCNHPLGGADVVSVASVVGKYYPEGLKIPANDFLMLLTGIKDMLIPVNKIGGQSRSLSEKINQAYASDSQLMFFPAGMVSRKTEGKIADLQWKKNFVAKSIEYKRDIVPIRIDARNSKLFYFIAKLRAKLGIKFNVEMALLVRELRKQMNKTIKITIGKPIPYTSLDESKSASQWAQYIREKVYKL